VPTPRKYHAVSHCYRDLPDVQLATYLTSDIPAYRGNPWIEALPPIRAATEWTKLLATEPSLAAPTRGQSVQARLHALTAQEEFFCVNTRVLELADDLDLLLRAGLAGRSPLDPRLSHHLRALHRLSSGDAAPSIPRLRKGKNSHATGLSLIGASGNGKTSSLMRILDTYPQVIEHAAGPCKDIPHRQLTWLYLDAHAAGTFKSLCVTIIQQIDALLGTPYAELFHTDKLTTPRLQDVVRTIGNLHGLGLIIIDEIQDVSRGASGGDEGFIKELVHLMNSGGIPLVLTGTPQAEDLLAEEFRLSVRTASGGYHPWNPWEFSSEWRTFTKKLFKYQVLADPTPHSDELSRALHRSSGGIVGSACRLFTLAQKIAVRNGLQTLTDVLLRERVREKAGPLCVTLDQLSLSDAEKALLSLSERKRAADIVPVKPRTSPEQRRRNQKAASEIKARAASGSSK
jgi:hypothetical protein